MSLPQASFWIASYATLQGLGPALLPGRSYLHSLDDVVVWSLLLICRICLLGVAKGSLSEQLPLDFVLTLFMDEMLDVARYGPHAGKLRLL